MRLWFCKESPSGQARLYCRLPRSRNPGPQPPPKNPNYVWIPRSVVEHTTKRAPIGDEWPEHDLRLPEWFILKEGL